MPPKGSTVEPKYPPPCATSEEAQTLLARVQGEYKWDRRRTSGELTTLYSLKRQVAMQVARKTQDQLPGEESWVKFMQMIERDHMENAESDEESDDQPKTKKTVRDRAAAAGIPNVDKCSDFADWPEEYPRRIRRKYTELKATDVNGTNWTEHVDAGPCVLDMSEKLKKELYVKRDSKLTVPTASRVADRLQAEVEEFSRSAEKFMIGMSTQPMKRMYKYVCDEELAGDAPDIMVKLWVLQTQEAAGWAEGFLVNLLKNDPKCMNQQGGDNGLKAKNAKNAYVYAVFKKRAAAASTNDEVARLHAENSELKAQLAALAAAVPKAVPKPPPAAVVELMRQQDWERRNAPPLPKMPCPPFHASREVQLADEMMAAVTLAEPDSA